mmetsp:Transcript_114995/g.171868  ORF Transcript_114995/g.171868 Transcript_114995/m.171868 type:complete len:119 (+) Transcript_114995:14-370(+)
MAKQNNSDLIELPSGITSYYQLLCDSCDTPSCTPQGKHYLCNFCSQEFHTTIYKSGGGYSKYGPEICPKCVVERSLCMMCGVYTQNKPCLAGGMPGGACRCNGKAQFERHPNAKSARK